MGTTDLRTSDTEPSLLADGLQAISYATLSLLVPFIGWSIAPILYTAGVFHLSRAGMPRQANSSLVLAAGAGGAAAALGWVSVLANEPSWCTPAAFGAALMAMSAYAHAMSALVGAFAAPQLAARWRRVGRVGGMAAAVVLITPLVPASLPLPLGSALAIFAIWTAARAQSLTREWVRVCFGLDRVATTSGK